MSWTATTCNWLNFTNRLPISTQSISKTIWWLSITAGPAASILTYPTPAWRRIRTKRQSDILKEELIATERDIDASPTPILHTCLTDSPWPTILKVSMKLQGHFSNRHFKSLRKWTGINLLSMPKCL